MNKQDKYNRIFVGDFVGEFENMSKIYAVFVIDKDDETKEILTDDVFYYTKRQKERMKWLEIGDWEFIDEHSQNALHKYLEEIPLDDLPEKLKYLRLIKVRKIQKKLGKNLAV